MSKCAFCQHEVTVGERVGRNETCPSCERDLHCCLQCQFYDESSHYQCRESQADFVADKDRANFCDYFKFDPQVVLKVADKETQRAKLETLFKQRK